MDIELLQTFLEVNRTRHFGKAASNLYISQSTVSARISQLEQLVGGAVFNRVRNDLQLTSVGERLVSYAETITATWVRARQEVATSDAIEQLLVVGGVPSMWDIMLNQWLARVYSQYPGVAIIGEVKNSNDLVAALLGHTLDIAFMFEAPQPKGIKVHELSPEPLVMVSSEPGQSVEQAVQGDYIFVDWGTLFANTHAKYFPDLQGPRLRLEQGRLARDFILGHGGSCYLARSMAEEDIRHKRLFEVDAPVIYRNAYALYQDTGDKVELIHKALQAMQVTA